MSRKTRAKERKWEERGGWRTTTGRERREEYSTWSEGAVHFAWEVAAEKKERRR